jgi:hypothetical protein
MNLKCIKSCGQLQNSFVTVKQYDACLLLHCKDTGHGHMLLGYIDNAYLDRNKLTAPKLVLYK